MNADRLFEAVARLERRLEELRDEVTVMEPSGLGARDRSDHRTETDRRQLSRHLRDIEAGIAKASRAARDARRLLRSYATPEVTESEGFDPSDEVEP